MTEISLANLKREFSEAKWTEVREWTKAQLVKTEQQAPARLTECAPSSTPCFVCWLVVDTISFQRFVAILVVLRYFVSALKPMLV